MQKMNRDPTTMILGVLFNLAVILFYYSWLTERMQPSVLFPHLHEVMLCTSLVLLVTAITCFALSVILDPGYVKPHYDYTQMIENALSIGLHLDNFCSYCEVIKSQTSFHCTFCHKCTELFDHHCPFINNCLGYKNHKYFLIFLFSYSLYILCIFFETLRHFIEVFQAKGFSCIETDTVSTIVLLLIMLHIPVLSYQLKQQCGTLCTKPT